jgi:hypothetical protein
MARMLYAVELTPSAMWPECTMRVPVEGCVRSAASVLAS